LLVEDNVHYCLLISTILKSMGVVQIVEARDSTEALRVLRHFDADLLIADWKLGLTEGVVFAHKIRLAADSPNRLLPMIMITTSMEAALQAEARDVGVDEFLFKPISAKVLADRVRSAIAEPRPYIRSGTYFGPDRRRRRLTISHPDRRLRKPDVVDRDASKRDAAD
jgi:CheY-like chemotaxis protein